MPKTDALYYQSLKTALLRRFELTDDRFKQKFRSCRPEQCETFAHRWIEMSKVPRSFEGLYDLMLRDQFIHICNQDLRLFLKERIPDNLQKMADLADQFKDARNMSAVQGVDKGRNYSQKKPQQPKRTEKPDVKETAGKVNRFVPKSERICYRCNRFGHTMPECKIKPVVGSVSEIQSDGKCSSEQSKGKPVCFVSTLTSDSIVDSMVNNSPTTLTSGCQKTANFIMPISAGYVNGLERYRMQWNSRSENQSQ